MFCFCRLFFPLYVSGIFMLHHSQDCRFLIPPFTQQYFKSGDSPNPFLPFFFFFLKKKNPTLDLYWMLRLQWISIILKIPMLNLY